MGRLTEKSAGYFEYDLVNGNHLAKVFADFDSFFNYNLAVRKLGEYEDAEEDGLLIRLPCKVGDILWYLFKNKNKVIPVEVMKIKYECEAENYGVFILERILIQGKGIEPTVIHFSDIGKRVFLTKAEAEQALAKMKGE